ncbi:hypothetical protein BDV95DRAFT_482819 [Massariosphaeria phaeospora]|uniref:RED-like N-terminal domain-containing protein n=1 Tax=Massariosphaeria phaeospora TaxID=100035 RepID=A0A7C8MM69_9PLEO|nr:hypothetical protein BDV95DRAFT_482819 [Massariosphaeria phaeospora]
MDNQQFRRLVLASSRKPDGDAGSPPATRPAGTVLGARKHSSIPMTPRQVGRNSVQAEFARQFAERNAKAHPAKKLRSVAPKGTKLAAGYVDRTQSRTDDENNELAQRIKNLEEAMKLGQIDRDTFENLVQEITGGDLRATHLVKGLDRRLLERVRKGEDLHDGEPETETQQPELEDEFDHLAEHEIGPIIREKVEKKGDMAPPPPVAGTKRTRNDILAELKAQRQAAADAAAAEHAKRYPSLGPGFRKLNPRGETSRIEVDAKGRDVLLVTDADGKEKRKIRKPRNEAPPPELRHDLDDATKPINMHNLPPPKPQEPESEDEDIFEGVGSSYNPLADLEDGEDEDSSDEENEARTVAEGVVVPVEEGEIPKTTPNPQFSPNNENNSELSATQGQMLPPAASSSQHTTKRNYFKDSTPTSVPSARSTGDGTVLAALKKVRTLDPNSTLLQPSDPEEARLKKRAAELATRDRDLEDIDMGFGGSRFDDAEEMERDGEKVKFSEWKGLGGEQDDDGDVHDGSGKKRKRGPKKRKGDKNSATDILKAMDRQKETKALG